MKMTERIASLSYDTKHQVGSIIVKKDFSTIASVGFNGNYSGGENKRDSDHTGESGFLHAEENAIIKANTEHPENYIVFVTMTPCPMCAKRIANKGIKEIIYLNVYSNATGTVEICRNAGIGISSVYDKLYKLYFDTPFMLQLATKKMAWENVPLETVQAELTSLLYGQLDAFFELDKAPLQRIPAFEIPLDKQRDSINTLVLSYIRAFCHVLYQIA